MTDRVQGITILGSTGSIGANTLDVLSRHRDRYRVFALTAASRVEPLFEQCLAWVPRFAVMTDPVAAGVLEGRLRAQGCSTRVLAGASALDEVAAHPDADVVMAAIVGAAGLSSALHAARSGKRLLLANKEAIVMGGRLFLEAVSEGGATLLPIDSEHSAVFQSLPHDRTLWSETVDKIILTASGGPFRERDPAELRHVTPEQACAHPNWVMGRKISVDSATMMNKALEVIEAHYLFGLPPQRIEVVIHPQSVIHSMVQFRDASVVAQLGTPDMRVPIAYGLSWPSRLASGAATLDFSRLAAMTFESADRPDHQKRFPGLRLAWRCLNEREGSCVVLNAANEVAVAAFLAGVLRFDRIHAVNEGVLDRLDFSVPVTLGDRVALDDQARALASGLVRGLGA